MYENVYVIVMACVRKMTKNSSQGRQTGAKGLGLIRKLGNKCAFKCLY